MFLHWKGDSVINHPHSWHVLALIVHCCLVFQHTAVLPFLLIEKYLVYHQYPTRRRGILTLLVFAFLYLCWYAQGSTCLWYSIWHYTTVTCNLSTFAGTPRALDAIHTLYTFLLPVLVTPLMNSFNKTEAAISPMQAMLPFLRLIYLTVVYGCLGYCG